MTITFTSSGPISENATMSPVVGTVMFTSIPPTGTVTYSLTDNAGGLFAIDATTGVVTLAGALDAEMDLNHSIVVAVLIDGMVQETSTFSITINDVDEFDVSTPIDSNDAANTLSEAATPGAVVGITASASDDDATTNAVTYSLTSNPGGLFAIDATTGVVTLAGSLDFETATSHDITVQAESADGSTSTADFTINVTDENDNAPTFDSAASVDVDENTTAVLDLVASDVDTVGGPIAFTITGGADSSLFTIDTANQLRFTGGQDFEVPADGGGDNVFEVTVQASDGLNTTEQTISVTLQDVNEAPTAVVLTEEQTTVAENVDFSGTDAGVVVATIAITDDALGTNAITLTGADAANFEVVGNELVFIGSASDFEMPSDANTDGIFDVTVSVSDATVIGSSPVTASVQVEVTDVNEAPVIDAVASDTAPSGNEDTAIAGSIAASDVDGDMLTFTLATDGGPANGTVTLNADGSYSYLGNQDFNGDDSFTVEVSDGEFTETIEVNVTVDVVNDAPVIDADASGTAPSGNEDTAIAGSIAASDVDGDTLTFTLATDGGPANGTVTLNGDGSYSYLGNQDFNGDDSFTVEVSDGDLTDTIVVNVTVDAVNDAPVAAAAVAVDAVQTAASFDVALLEGASDNDEDVLDVVSLALVSGDTSGLTINLEDNTITVDPAAYASLLVDETETIIFSYTITDGNGGETPQTATITLTGTNDLPVVGAAIESSVDEDDAMFSIDLLDGVTDADAGQTATLDLMLTSALPAGVTLSGSTLTVDPASSAFQGLAAGETQIVPVTFNVVDVDGGTTPQTATITITGGNDVPTIDGVFVGDITDQVVSVTGTISVTDLDDGQSGVQAGQQAGSFGTFDIAENGEWVFTPGTDTFIVNSLPAGSVAQDVFNITSIDGTVVETVTITITGTNDAAIFSGDTTGIGDDFEATTITGQIISTDIDGNDGVFLPVTASATSDNGFGTFTLTAAGAWVFVVNTNNPFVAALVPGGSTTDSFTIFSEDGTPLSVAVTINGNNELAGADDALEILPGEGEVTVIEGTSGDDRLDGGFGIDLLLGFEGDDVVVGGVNDDILLGLDGNDILSGGSENDLLIGGFGQDLLDGGTGNDVLEGGAGDDTINGGEGDDVILGEAGSNTLFGNGGNDIIVGNDQVDVIFGEDGDDIIVGGAGMNTLSGGLGNDLIIGGNDLDVVSAGDGNDTVETNGGDDNIIAGDGDNIVLAGAGNDIVSAGSGADVLIGDLGDDLISGGEGADTLIGGLGNDTLNGGDGNDQLIAQFGFNTLNGGNGDDFLEGAVGNDVLSGDAGNDFIIGLGGNDTISGGAGTDTLIGGEGDDIFLFLEGNDAENIVDFGDDEDTLDFSAFNFADVTDVLSGAIEVNNGVFFDFGDGDTAFVENITAAQLSDDIIV